MLTVLVEAGEGRGDNNHNKFQDGIFEWLHIVGDLPCRLRRDKSASQDAPLRDERHDLNFMTGPCRCEIICE